MRTILSFSLLISFIFGKEIPFRPKEFCTDSNRIESMFTMGNTTYLMKGNQVYTKRFNERYRDKTSLNPKFIFKRNFVSISTGLFVSSIPECKYGYFPIISNEKQKKCNELQKLYRIGFVIGYRDNSKRQSYSAIKFIEREGLSTIVPIENNIEMPFAMKKESEIVSSELFPLDSNEKVIYLHSTFDERNYSLVHLVKERVSGNIKLFIQSLNVELKNWSQYSNEKVSPNNQVIQLFIGFIQIGVALKDRKTYAIVVLNSKVDPIVVDFIPDYQTTNSLEQKHFVEQKSVHLIEDVFGCIQSFGVNSQTENPLSLDSDQTSDDPTNKSPKKKPKSNSSSLVDSDKSETEQEISRELMILFILLISIFTIGFILFFAMILIVIYIRLKNTKSKENKSKVKEKKSFNKN